MAVLKQLVLVARYILPTGDVETNCIHICDIPDGTATNIEASISLTLKLKILILGISEVSVVMVLT